jgi:hypothetical protein
MVSTRSQAIMLWWGWIFMIIFGLAWGFLIGMLPLPAATQTAEQVAAFYAEHSWRIRWGAAICSWTGAFMVPFTAVAAIQLARLEKGIPAWAIVSFGSGMMMSMFLVIPPLLWGVAAFSPGRPPDVTLLMHEFANLMLVTTDQYYIFQMVAIAVVSLTQKVDPHSPFPRWIGYFTIWAAIMFEAGVAGFLPKTGPFSWNGLFVFWFPLTIFGTWYTTLCFAMLRALKRQRADGL